MTLDRTRRRRRGQRALRVVRSPTRQEHEQLLSENPQAQPMVELPPEPESAQEQVSDGRPVPVPAPASSSLAATTQRLLLAHAQRARHLLSHRSAVASLSRLRRREMLEEMEHMKRTIRTLQNQIAGTTRSVESMENLVVHLQRITDGLREPDNGTDAEAD